MKSQLEAGTGMAFACDHCRADLAAMPERTVLAIIDWTDGHAVITAVICPADDDVILKVIEQPTRPDRLSARLAGRVRRFGQRLQGSSQKDHDAHDTATDVRYHIESTLINPFWE